LGEPRRVHTRTVQGDDIQQLRDDIRILRVLLDAALDRGADELLLRACASILSERRRRLEQLEPRELDAAE
jgi:hypothetical protein